MVVRITCALGVTFLVDVGLRRRICLSNAGGRRRNEGIPSLGINMGREAEGQNAQMFGTSNNNLIRDSGCWDKISSDGDNAGR